MASWVGDSAAGLLLHCGSSCATTFQCDRASRGAPPPDSSATVSRPEWASGLAVTPASDHQAQHSGGAAVPLEVLGNSGTDPGARLGPCTRPLPAIAQLKAAMARGWGLGEGFEERPGAGTAPSTSGLGSGGGCPVTWSNLGSHSVDAPVPLQAKTPSTACASAIGSEVRLCVSAERWVERACKLGSRCSISGGSADPFGRGKRVPASVHSRITSENGMTSLCSCLIRP